MLKRQHSRHLQLLTSHQRLLPLFQLTIPILLLMAAPSNNPKTTMRNKVTTSWSRGESLSEDSVRKYIVNVDCKNLDIRKHRASTSPSFPVAVSGLVGSKTAPSQVGSSCSRHHFFVQVRHGWDGFSTSNNGKIV